MNRIADALDHIITLLEKMANPPLMCRGQDADGKQFVIGATDFRPK